MKFWNIKFNFWERVLFLQAEPFSHGRCLMHIHSRLFLCRFSAVLGLSRDDHITMLLWHFGPICCNVTAWGNPLRSVSEYSDGWMYWLILNVLELDPLEGSLASVSSGGMVRRLLWHWKPLWQLQRESEDVVTEQDARMSTGKARSEQRHQCWGMVWEGHEKNSKVLTKISDASGIKTKTNCIKI